MAYLRTKSKDGHNYYYIVEGRRVDGKVKQTVLEYIGTEENLKKFVVEQYMQAQSVEDGSPSPAAGYSFESYTHGAPFALFRVAEIIRMEDAMKEVFPPRIIRGFPRERLLLLSMLQRAVCPASRRAFSSWASTTSLPYHLNFNAEDIDAAAFREAMDGITDEQIKSVWSKIVQNVLQITGAPLDVFHLDCTNIVTVVDSKAGPCLVCRRDPQRQKGEDLQQFRLTALTNADLQIPLVWEIVDASKCDSAEFADFTKLIRQEISRYKLNTEDITLVFDDDICSQREFAELGMQVICAHSLAEQQHLTEIDLEQYDNVEMMPGKEKLAYRIENMTFSGLDGVGILTFSKDLKESQLAELDRDIARLKAEFADITGLLSDPASGLYADLNQEKDAVEFENDKEVRKLKTLPVDNELGTMKKIVEEKLFKGMDPLKQFVSVLIEKNSDGRYQCQLEFSEKKKKAYIFRHFGKKLFCSTRKEWTTPQILAAYFRQECIDRLFTDSNLDELFTAGPQFRLSHESIRPHLFCCLAALALTQVLRSLLKPTGIDMTAAELLDQLEMVRDGWLIHNNKKVSRVLEDMTDQPELQKLWTEVEKVTAIQKQEKSS